VFCPNCGTQNPETSQNCSKCNFNLKGAAAPKFKGTMLMMNQAGGPTPAPPRPVGGALPGAAPGAPQPAAVAGARSAVGAGAGVPSKLKGTMVGVAPPSAFGAGPAVPRSTPPPPPAAVDRLATPGPQPSPFGMGGGAAVNPLGGTVVADSAPAYAPPPDAFPPPPGQYGPPPGAGPTDPAPALPYGAPPPPTGGPYGAPPQPMGMAGAPQGQMGSPPGQELGGIMTPAGTYGAPPPPFGAPPAPAGGYGFNAGPPQGYPMQPGYGMPGPGPQMALPPQMAGLGLATGGGPMRRNAVMTMLLPIGVMFGSILVFGILAAVVWAPLMLLGVLGYFAGLVLILLSFIKMANEVKSVTRNPAFAWWPIFVPVYSIYYILVLVPQEVTRAKQMLGVQQPARSIVVYFFFPMYALAADLNDMVR
jgi:hypothetical protein